MSIETVAVRMGAGADLALAIEQACHRFGIVTALQQSHFLGQLAHESAQFRVLIENLNYSAEALLRTWPSRFTATTAAQYARQPERIANRVYASRMGNGDEASGDGWRYRGRGLIQLTGRENYSAYSRALYRDTRIVSAPERVAEPADAALSAGWYWSTRGINAMADRDDVAAVTRAINGGLHGYDDRLARTRRAQALFAELVA